MDISSVFAMSRRETARDTFEKITAPEGKKQSTDDQTAVYVKKLVQNEISRVLVFSEGRKQKEVAMDTLKGKNWKI